MQPKCRCCPPLIPPFRPGLADQTGSPVLSTAGMCGPLLHKVQAERLPDKAYQTPAFEYDSTTRPPTHRDPTPPPSWQHCPRVPESLRQRFVDFPRWALTVGTSCASLPALIFLTYPEREQLLRQRAADVTVYTHAPFCASQQTPEAPESRPTQV